MSKFDMLALVFSGLATKAKNEAVSNRIMARKLSERLQIEELERQKELDIVIAAERQSDLQRQFDSQVATLRAATEGGATVASLAKQAAHRAGIKGLNEARALQNYREDYTQGSAAQRALKQEVYAANMADQNIGWQSSLSFFGDVAGASLHHVYKPTTTDTRARRWNRKYAFPTS